MKIGYGIIRTPSEPVNNDMVLGSTDSETMIHVHTDEHGIGVARSRNNCIHYLYEQGCDIIFLSDVDIYPVMRGWERYFSDCHEASGIHFFGLPEVFKSIPRKFQEKGEIMYWNGQLNQFVMMTRRFVDTVGYYNSAYDRYGFEDAAMNMRAVKSGLCGDGSGLPSPVRTSAYIYSEDVFAVKTNPSSLTKQEKDSYIAKNKVIFDNEIKDALSGKIYYPHN